MNMHNKHWDTQSLHGIVGTYLVISSLFITLLQMVVILYTEFCMRNTSNEFKIKPNYEFGKHDTNVTY